MLAVLLAAWSGKVHADAQLPFVYDRLGSGVDVVRNTRSGTVLMGGNHDVAEAIQWLCELSAGGDFLVIRSEGTDAYNAYVARLCPAASSVATLIVPDRRAAFHPDVATRVGQAEALWIASGDQSAYLSRWRGTPLHQALRAALDRGVPAGGTSAGMIVLTPFIYPAQDPQGVTSQQALADPFHRRVTLERDFVSLPLLAGTLGDSHFRARDRMGRDLAFMCRVARLGWTTRPRVIAVDEDTALLIDDTGSARVVGEGSVYLLRAPGPAEVCAPRAPVTYRHIDVYRIDAAGTFDVTTWRGRKGVAYRISAHAGVLESTQPGGSPY